MFNFLNNNTYFNVTIVILVVKLKFFGFVSQYSTCHYNIHRKAYEYFVIVIITYLKNILANEYSRNLQN